MTYYTELYLLYIIAYYAEAALGPCRTSPCTARSWG